MKHLKNNIQNIQLAGVVAGINWYDIHDSVDKKTLHNIPAQKWLYKHIKDHFGIIILDKNLFK
tara:strand:+ start:157 stop:345 length:189 start_codon:yes stop_codon:yes gene_type:complete